MLLVKPTGIFLFEIHVDVNRLQKETDQARKCINALVSSRKRLTKLPSEEPARKIQSEKGCINRRVFRRYKVVD